MRRCVGGPLDNVTIDWNGNKMTVPDPEVPHILRTGRHRDGTSVEPSELIKYHTYQYRGGVYLHDHDCCPTTTYEQWVFDQTGHRPWPERPESES